MTKGRLEAFSDGVVAIITIIAIGLAFVPESVAQAIYVLVTMMWFVPDRRIEAAVARG